MDRLDEHVCDRILQAREIPAGEGEAESQAAALMTLELKF